MFIDICGQPIGLICKSHALFLDVGKYHYKLCNFPEDGRPEHRLLTDTVAKQTDTKCTITCNLNMKHNLCLSRSQTPFFPLRKSRNSPPPPPCSLGHFCVFTTALVRAPSLLLSPTISFLYRLFCYPTILT